MDGCRSCSRPLAGGDHIAAILTAAVLAVPTAPVLPDGCDHIHRSTVAKHRIYVLLHNTRPEPLRGRVRHYVTCVSSRAKARRLGAYANALNGWRRREPQRSWIRYHRLDPYWQQWARRVTACESGWNRYASNGTHHSFYQWLPSTYAAAGGTGSPYSLPWPRQTLLAVSWAQLVGQSQWTCS